MKFTTYRALLVEDSTFDAKLIEEMVAHAQTASFQIEIESARDLANALRRLETGGIDVVVLDLTLPDSFGITTFTELQNAAPEIPVVVVSGIGQESIAMEALKLGAQDYIVKDQLDANVLPRSLLYAIERHRLHRSLRASEERFRQLTENMHEVFWLHDVQQQRLLYVSPAYERIWGRKREELDQLTKDWVDAIHSDDQASVFHAASDKLIDRPFSQEYRIVRPDGTTRWIWDRGVPIRNAKQEVYRIAGTAEDITERRHLEKEVLEVSTREQQRISQDLHDTVGQELTGLSYMARSLARKLSERDAAEADLAEEIVSAMQRTLGEVRGAIRGLAPVEVDVNGLMVALEQLAHNVQRRIGLSCKFQCDRPVPVEDIDAATNLYRIAQESINNAVRHARADSILVRLESQAGRVMLQITDDGVGIQHPDQQQGMGLRIMRYRATAMGGTLDIQSQPDLGTSVTCSLKQDLPDGDPIAKSG